ncbi:hypothetical protein ACQCSX_07530 [Pseudarthrobacter sp. P1]|uniref:hypothetical protein n=1 Tax=Pseudarthrobacter sp. P1 TaxID=3418418 RepID=UPI003CF8355E
MVNNPPAIVEPAPTVPEEEITAPAAEATPTASPSAAPTTAASHATSVPTATASATASAPALAVPADNVRGPGAFSLASSAVASSMPQILMVGLLLGLGYFYFRALRSKGVRAPRATGK